MPGGRPTVATTANLEKAEKYLAEGWIELEEKFPTVAGLSIYLDISRESLYERKEFSDVLGRIKSKQEMALVSKGLSGVYNPTIAKLLLSSKHGYVEKSAQDLTNAGEKFEPIVVYLPTKLNDDGSEPDTSK